MANETVGFIGLGAMGNGMAKALVKAGFQVNAFDAYSPALAAGVAAGMNACDSPEALAATGIKTLVLMVVSGTQAVVLQALLHPQESEGNAGKLMGRKTSGTQIPLASQKLLKPSPLQRTSHSGRMFMFTSSRGVSGRGGALGGKRCGDETSEGCCGHLVLHSVTFDRKVPGRQAEEKTDCSSSMRQSLEAQSKPRKAPSRSSRVVLRRRWQRQSPPSTR